MTWAQEFVVPPEKLSQSPYAPWAHYHWIWWDHANENQSSLLQLVHDYQSYDIPVGAINFDSAWPDKYQNFIWNKQKFPDAKSLIDTIHSMNIKVILWITSTINNDSTNFNEGLKNGYYLNNGELVHWPHGNAAILDYSNPKAVEWWHSQLDYVLDLGIDGWKCDYTGNNFERKSF